MEEKKTLIDCRDVALGYEGKALSRHLSFQFAYLSLEGLADGAVHADTLRNGAASGHFYEPWASMTS